MPAPGPSSDQGSATETTIHVRKAIDGDPESLEWLVRRLTPLLRSQAAFRLGRRTASMVSADDLVAEAWLAVLPRLGTIHARMGRYTPVLLAFLATTIRRLANRKLIERAEGAARTPHGAANDNALNQLAASVRSGLTVATREELAHAIAGCIERLDPEYLEVVILHGVEGMGYAEISAETGEEPGTLAQRYYRAVRKLRTTLPRSVFDELEDE